VRGSREREQLVAELSAARQRIASLESELARGETRDPLVPAVLSLRAFRAQFELDAQRAHRYERPLSVAVVDIDGFRALNVAHGYQAGDAVLAAVGEAIELGTRAHDLVCRTGGDEFAVFLPETDATAAALAMERIIREFEGLEAGEVHGLSASVGVAALERGQSPEALLAAARGALEQAREAGGGQVAQHVSGSAARDGYVQAGEGAVAALASALEERDRYTSEHSESVVVMTERVAQSLALDADEIDRIKMAALLHDIGKVGIPDEILHKPGPLDEREWEVMRTHPAIGERILRAIPGLGQVARIVRHEHERWDGAGYPDGLAGDRIPIGSRVILACDAYHAMTSDRPYRVAMPHAEAVAELTRNAGSQFDARVVETLVGYLYGRRQSGLAVA
jgi:diguanylate cyclase (GGDEF)-like protein